MNSEITKAPDKLLSVTTVEYQDIVDYYRGRLDRTSLAEPLQQYIQKMDFCADLIREYKSRLKVVPTLCSAYGISEPTARILFERTQMVFGITSKLSSSFYVDILLGDVSELYKKAMKASDFRAAAAALKLQKELISEHMGNADAAKYENFEMKPITIGFFPEQFKAHLPDNLDEQIERLKKLKRNKEFGQKVAELIDYDPAE